MERNVVSWKAALASGFEPRLYGYLEGGLPTCTTEAKLECKIWASKVMAVNCYFSEIGTDRKFVLTVYRDREDKQYHLSGNAIDFASCELGQIYRVTVALNGRNRPFFSHAELVG